MSTFSLRRPAHQQLTEREFDLIVIGGGITGAGIALDAAARGLTTVLIEKGDFASGTSSKSTKLVHGGLRYLQNLQFGVTLESVRERELLEKLAPHMVWRVPFIIPQYKKDRLKNLKVRIGLCIYDLMAGLRKNGFHQRISREEILQSCPGINADGLTGGLRYYDCRTDDARYTLAVIAAAVERGALAINHAQVVAFERSGGTVCGVRVHDRFEPTTPEFVVRGKVIVNATGVWSQKTAELSGGKSMLEIVPAKGIHITLPKSRLPISEAMIVNSAHDKRFCFAVPWYDSVIVGTTDTEYEGELERLKAEPWEIRYVLDALNAQFPESHLTTADITGSFAGLRPLVRERGAGSTAEVSRKHSLIKGHDGVISIAGGKLTTYRPMAAEVVDLVAKCLQAKERGRKVKHSPTGKIMIGEEPNIHRNAVLDSIAAGSSLPGETLATLYTMYGKLIDDVLALVKERPELAQPIAPGHPFIMAQVAYAVRNEAAITIDDVLSRRVRLTITDRKAALRSADAVSRLMARELGWSEHRRQNQVIWFKALHERG
jgi:glycerol-3-phosphate dehydrogenase